MLNNRAACLHGFPCEPEDIVELLYCVAHHTPAKELPQIAVEIGRKPQGLRNEVNPNDDLHRFPSDALGSLAVATKERPRLAQYLSELQGGVHVPLPQVAATSADLFGVTSDISVQLGQALDVVKRRLANDGRLTRDELPAIEREIQDVIVAALQFRLCVRQIAAEEVRPTATPGQVLPHAVAGGRR